MRRAVALAVAAAAVTTLAACSTADVRSEAAVERTEPTAAPSSAPPTPPPTPAPATTVPPAAPDTSEPGSEPSTTVPAGPPSAGEGAGDSLFPELGTDDLDVQSYDLRLRYDPGTLALEAEVTIIAAVATTTAELVLDADGMEIVAVEVDGTTAPYDLSGGELVIAPAAPVGPDQPVVIDVAYRDRADPISSAVGLQTGWFSTPGGSYVLNEPDGAHTWLPSNDHPSDKATWRFEITVPSGTTAVANGELVEQRADPEGDTWVWEQREPMATYLVQLLTGDYEVLDGGTAGTVPIVNVALADDVERMAPYFELTDDQMAYFEPLFGPYPLDRYGLAFTDSFPGLAMETQGRSLFSRDDFPGGSPGAIEHLLLSHELAHSWFGNAVTPADWSDLWLNEAFATYGQWMWLGHVGLFALDAQANSNLAFRQDFAEPTGEPTVANLFGFERYDGGAVVVHALRRELGDELFFGLLQRWVADNDGTSRTTEDFIALASEVAGRDLTAFFDAWLFAADVPDEYPG